MWQLFINKKGVQRMQILWWGLGQRPMSLIIMIPLECEFSLFLLLVAL